VLIDCRFDSTGAVAAVAAAAVAIGEEREREGAHRDSTPGARRMTMLLFCRPHLSTVMVSHRPFTSSSSTSDKLFPPKMFHDQRRNFVSARLAGLSLIAVALSFAGETETFVSPNSRIAVAHFKVSVALCPD
jgi:hypothetical protein